MDVAFIAAASAFSSSGGTARSLPAITNQDGLVFHAAVVIVVPNTSPNTTRDHYIHSIAAETRLALQRVQDFVIGPNWSQIPA